MSKSSQRTGRKFGPRWAAVLVGMAVLGGAPPQAEAQPKATPHARELAEAERLGAEADKLEQEGKYDAARPLAERARGVSYQLVFRGLFCVCNHDHAGRQLHQASGGRLRARLQRPTRRAIDHRLYPIPITSTTPAPRACSTTKPQIRRGHRASRDSRNGAGCTSAMKTAASKSRASTVGRRCNVSMRE
jgi:hypothetical protein